MQPATASTKHSGEIRKKERKSGTREDKKNYPSNLTSTIPGLLAAFKRAGYISSRDVIVKSAVDNTIMGKGRQAYIHSIPGVGGYIIRVPRYPKRILEGNLVAAQNPFGKRYFGQPIARIGEEVEVLKRLEGVQGGIPYGGAPKDAKHKILWDEEPFKEQCRQAYKAHLERTASMPQSSFTQLARDLMFIDRHPDGYFLDPNPNNILVDIKGKSFNIIDLKAKKEAYSFDKNIKNNFAFLIGTLLDNYYVYFQQEKWKSFTQENSVVEDEHYLTGLRKEILRKSLIACLESGLPIPEEPFQGGSYYWVFNPEYSFRFAGLKGKWPEIRAILMKKPTNFFERLKKRRQLENYFQS